MVVTTATTTINNDNEGKASTTLSSAEISVHDQMKHHTNELKQSQDENAFLKKEI